MTEGMCTQSGHGFQLAVPRLVVANNDLLPSGHAGLAAAPAGLRHCISLEAAVLIAETSYTWVQHSAMLMCCNQLNPAGLVVVLAEYSEVRRGWPG
jgi:hypothetical protein